jgi:hypothetical protein
MEEEKIIGYMGLPKNKVSDLNLEVNKEYDSSYIELYRYGLSIFRCLFDLVSVSDIRIHKFYNVECSEIDKVHSDPLHITCKHIKIIKEITIEDIAENIDDYRNKFVENLVITCNKTCHGRITNSEDRCVMTMHGYLGTVNNSGLFGIIYLDAFRCDCNLTSNNNIVVSIGKSNKINSSNTSNTFILREEDNILSVTGGFNNIISTGKNNYISCISETNRIICNGENNIVYLHGKYNSFKATIGTTIIYSERNSENENEATTVKTIYVDETNIKPDTWYNIGNGEIKECDK